MDTFVSSLGGSQTALVIGYIHDSATDDHAYLDVLTGRIRLEAVALQGRPPEGTGY